MKNPYFEFKQFRIMQDKTSMKVGTDGVLLGCLAQCTIEEGNILDIGTGTGLIALMMAQKYPKASITGIEINQSAWEQACDNRDTSNWRDRIQMQHTSLQYFNPSQHYDCIISNPPFYHQAKNSPNTNRAQSRNDEFLPASSIFNFAENYLSEHGELWLIYPIEQFETLNNLANKAGLNRKTTYFIRPNILKACHRVVVCYSKPTIKERNTSILCLEILKRHDYSEDYKQLCQDFYLHF